MSEKVNIPDDLSDFMKKNPTADFNDYLDELMVQAFIKDVEEKSKDAEPFGLFKTKAMSVVKTDPRYWDCECDENYIHDKSIEPKCAVCGSEHDECSDSRPNEIKLFFKDYKEDSDE
tara:strand:- start:465 stop:815 length:351 start_codon:yes stop_codon:yes gene_type:complete